MKFNTHIDWIYLILRTIFIMLGFVLGSLSSHIFHDTSHNMGGMLSAISTVIIISDTDLNDSFKTGLKRVVASFIGAFIGYIYFLLFDYSLWGMAGCIMLITLIAITCTLKGYSRIAIIVLIWIFVKSTLSDITPLENGLLRFLESALGVLVGLFGVWLLRLLDKEVTAPKK